MRDYVLRSIYQGRLTKGDDLIDALTDLIKQKGIVSGTISGIGAVSSAKLGYFNQQTMQYEERHFDEAMEIVSLKGNISLRDNQVFPHIHALLSRGDFSTIGGHLFNGTIVYAFEFEILAFEGQPLFRELDHNTGLFLWKL